MPGQNSGSLSAGVSRAGADGAAGRGAGLERGLDGGGDELRPV